MGGITIHFPEILFGLVLAAILITIVTLIVVRMVRTSRRRSLR
jgi:hypothetical protein